MSRTPTSRREFLADVGRGMLAAGVTASFASDLGLVSARAFEDVPKSRLKFGNRDRLVDQLQTIEPGKLLPWIAQELKSGTEVKEFIAAAALANARVFGGEDYIGFHTFMALSPALHMADEMPSDLRALPTMKVLYRHASRLKDKGNREDTLRPVELSETSERSPNAAQIREAVHARQIAPAEQLFAAATRQSAEGAWNSLLETVQEAPEVHRVVLAHRAWDMLELVGQEHAETLLRQSLRYCVKNDQWRERLNNQVTNTLAKVMEQHKLEGRARGDRVANPMWLERFSQTLFTSTPEQAADAVGGALAEGFDPEVIGEAIAITANQLVLRDGGRTQREVQANKPLGSVHGDSIGVHACDSANAWRHIARVSNSRNASASLILAGYQVAQDRIQRGGNFMEWQPRPYAEQLEKITATTPDKLLSELDGAIREKNQDLACAITQKYCNLGFMTRDVFQLCLKYALSEDGALHAEKYYRTTSDEFARTSSAFRDRQVVALARVTASAYGYKAPGYEEATQLLTRS